MSSPITKDEPSSQPEQEFSIEASGKCEQIAAENPLGFCEYKFKLIGKSKSRMEQLTTQLKWRLREGNGAAVYKIGVKDDGECIGLSDPELLESLRTLRDMCAELEAEWVVTSVKYGKEGKFAEVSVRLMQEFGTDIRVAVIGDVSSGKSTLIGVLTTGTLDNGAGSSRMSVLQHRHEQEQGHTSSLSRQIIGFDAAGKLTNYQESEYFGTQTGAHSAASNSSEEDGLTDQSSSSEEYSDSSEDSFYDFVEGGGGLFGGEDTEQSGGGVGGDSVNWRLRLEDAVKTVTLIDTAGEASYLRTTVQGLKGNCPDYCMLVVSATRLTRVTKQHESKDENPTGDGITANPNDYGASVGATDVLGHSAVQHVRLALFLDLPVFICMTKLDACTLDELKVGFRRLQTVIRKLCDKPLVCVNPPRQLLEDDSDENEPDYKPKLMRHSSSFIRNNVFNVTRGCFGMASGEDKSEEKTKEDKSRGIPVLFTSNVTGGGLRSVLRFLSNLPRLTPSSAPTVGDETPQSTSSSLFSVEALQCVHAVGLVVGGQCVQGRICEGSVMCLGPLHGPALSKRGKRSEAVGMDRRGGEYVMVCVTGIHRNRCKASVLLPGQSGSLACCLVDRAMLTEKGDEQVDVFGRSEEDTRVDTKRMAYLWGGWSSPPGEDNTLSPDALYTQTCESDSIPFVESQVRLIKRGMVLLTPPNPTAFPHLFREVPMQCLVKRAVSSSEPQGPVPVQSSIDQGNVDDMPMLRLAERKRAATALQTVRSLRMTNVPVCLGFIAQSTDTRTPVSLLGSSVLPLAVTVHLGPLRQECLMIWYDSFDVPSADGEKKSEKKTTRFAFLFRHGPVYIPAHSMTRGKVVWRHNAIGGGRGQITRAFILTPEQFTGAEPDDDSAAHACVQLSKDIQQVIRDMYNAETESGTTQSSSSKTEVLSRLSSCQAPSLKSGRAEFAMGFMDSVRDLATSTDTQLIRRMYGETPEDAKFLTPSLTPSPPPQQQASSPVSPVPKMRAPSPAGFSVTRVHSSVPTDRWLVCLRFAWCRMVALRKRERRASSKSTRRDSVQKSS